MPVERVETRATVLFDREHPLALDSGATLAPVEVAYETYGALDPARANAVVVCHALTGDAHAAGHHGDPDRRGWWDNIIGPGRPLDTDRYFVICANLLGGCQGTTGPSSVDPATGRPYGLRFPLFTVRDLVRVQRALVRHLGVERPAGGDRRVARGDAGAPVGPRRPGRARGGALVICASSRLSAQNIAFSAVARTAIMSDPDFRGGDYYEAGVRPDRGLAVARQMAHITYLSAESMRRKFGRRLQNGDVPRLGFDIDFQVESYLQHQGESFLRRFDANSYLYLSRVMDYFEPFADPVRTAAEVGAHDQRRPRRVVRHRLALRRGPLARDRAGADARTARRSPSARWRRRTGTTRSCCEVPEYHRTVAAFLDRVARERIPAPAAA